MAMKMCLAVALMVVATLTTTSFASPVQPITEAAGEEILPDLESINNEASIAQYPHDLEPIKNEASITQQNCPVDLNIPAFIFTIRVRVCSVTPTTCGLVRVRVGTVVNVLVQVCQLANGALCQRQQGNQCRNIGNSIQVYNGNFVMQGSRRVEVRVIVGIFPTAVCVGVNLPSC